MLVKANERSAVSLAGCRGPRHSREVSGVRRGEAPRLRDEALPRHRRRRRVRVLEQVADQRTRITDGLAGVRHLVAVGSGKGGVGKADSPYEGPVRGQHNAERFLRSAAAVRKGRVGRNRGSMRLWGLHLCRERRSARREAGWVDAGRVRATAAETARRCGPSERRRNGAAGRRVVRRRSACVKPRANPGVTTHDESGGRPSWSRPSTRSITHMWPSRQRGQSRNERPVRASSRSR